MELKDVKATSKKMCADGRKTLFVLHPPQNAHYTTEPLRNFLHSVYSFP